MEALSEYRLGPGGGNLADEAGARADVWDLPTLEAAVIFVWVAHRPHEPEEWVDRRRVSSQPGLASLACAVDAVRGDRRRHRSGARSVNVDAGLELSLNPILKPPPSIADPARFPIGNPPGYLIGPDVQEPARRGRRIRAIVAELLDQDRAVLEPPGFADQE